MNFRDDLKRQVQQATDLVRLIGEQVALRPKGREFMGLCPFHEDKNPSMHVSPAKQIYKCFSCGAGGDAFSFVMNYHKMTFPEALKHLAERAGIEVREQPPSREQRQQAGDRQLIAQANVQAVECFRALYRHTEHGRIARDYVERRGISREMVEAFHVGYAPDRWDGLVSILASKGWNRRSFELAGLISHRDNQPDSYYDRLRHRLIFPIFDAIGRPIAFGGRKLREEDEPKYLNSPETALFNKSATLYGLHLAKKPIIDSRTAVIVEGYTDVIACHQAGVCNVVATLGTALTAEHVRELRRYADKVVLIFDADEAGQKAADRAVEVFLTGDLDVAIAVLPSPDGRKMDPAELLAQEDGVEQWQAAMDAARDALDYQFQRIREQLDAADTMTGRQRVAEGYLQRLAGMGITRTGVLRAAMVRQRLAELLRISEAQVASLLKRFTPRGGAPRPTLSPPAPPPPPPPPAPAGRAASPPPATEPPEAQIDPDLSDAPEFRDPIDFVDLPPELAGPASMPASSDEPSDNETPVSVDRGGHDANNAQSDVAAEISDAKIRTLRLAELQLVGCLLRHEELFHHSLSDGRSLDEALSPGDLFTDEGRRLYERVYERLCEGQPLSLVEMLGDLAAEEQHELANLLTSADAQVEPVADHPEALANMLTAAAELLLGHHREAAYRLQRQCLTSRQDADVAVQVEALRRLLEERRANPSPVRIARLDR